MGQYENIRKELTDYYFRDLPGTAEDIRVQVFAEMDRFAAEHPDADSYVLKKKQYAVIAEHIRPKLFDGIPFYFDTGALVAYSDGKYNRGALHANAWVYLHNEHLFREHDPETYDAYQKKGGLFVQCGTYVDMLHLGIPFKKIFRVGLKGILAEIEENLPFCENDTERAFLDCAAAGIRALGRIAECFSEAAAEAGFVEIADTAARVPWEAPGSFYEGLCTLAFLRKALGSLEGMGFSSMGRVDVLLGSLYEMDKVKGVSEAEMLDLVSRFLLIWDCTLDRRQKFEKGYEYEMENSLTLGGTDMDGNPVYNGVTRLFLNARDNLRCLYPKMMLRFSGNSPEEYLRLISQPLVEGRSYSLFENDDTMIPALLKAGVEKADAVDYVVGGCWDALTPDTANKFSGEYLSLLIPFEVMVKQQTWIPESIGITFEPISEYDNFEQFYRKYLSWIGAVLRRKYEMISRGSTVWHRVNPVCALSALMEPCIPMRRDMTNGGIKYSRECVYFVGFAEMVDSMLVIKKLCYEEKRCTVSELLEQCRNDWPDEVLRTRALNVPSYGDGSEESTVFAGCFFDDLCALTNGMPTPYGGSVRVGFNLYTEVVRWGQSTMALPNGRKNGGYLSQGITPSRLCRNGSVYELLDSLRDIDFTKTAGNSSITVTLPANGLDEERMAALLRCFARNGVQAVQPNVVNREHLLAAKENPEQYGHIIVRVCGFSAPFVLLSSEYQDEIIARSVSSV